MALARAYDAMGNFEDAINESEIGEILDGADANILKQQSGLLRDALRTEGGRGYWSARLNLLSNSSTPENAPYRFAALYARLGEQSKSLDLLDVAWNKKDWNLRFLLIDQEFDGLRKDSRYSNLIEKIGFPKDWPLGEASIGRRPHQKKSTS